MSALEKLTPMFLANAAFCIENGSDVKPETRESIIDTLIKASDELSQGNAAKIAPTQGADARPVAIYQISPALHSGMWIDTDAEHYADYLDDYRRIVYATRDAAPSDAPKS